MNDRNFRLNQAVASALKENETYEYSAPAIVASGCRGRTPRFELKVATRGLPLSTSPPRGEGGSKVGQLCGQIVLEMRTKGEGGQNPADVPNGSLPINIAIIEGISGLVFICCWFVPKQITKRLFFIQLSKLTSDSDNQKIDRSHDNLVE